MFVLDIRSFGKVILASLLLVSLCLQSAPVNAGKIYRWVDEQGQLHFSDSPQNAPAELRQDAKEYRPSASSLTVTSPSLPSAAALPRATAPGGGPKDSISIPYTAKEGSANRVIIDITFNGAVTAPILVDTGSPGLIISDDLADRLGLFDKNGSGLMVLISGIGGNKAATRTIVENLTIGDITEEFIPAHIVSGMSDAYQGLIGMDILARYTLTIDPANQRLIANEIATTQDLPAGRSRSWWQTNFREFNYYTEFWDQQANLISKSDSPYSRLPATQSKKLKDFISRQQSEAQHLYSQLERFARWRNVPRHWRR